MEFASLVSSVVLKVALPAVVPVAVPSMLIAWTTRVSPFWSLSVSLFNTLPSALEPSGSLAA